MKTLFTFLVVLFCQSLAAQDIVSSKPDFEATILKEGTYFLGDQKSSLKHFRKVFKEQVKTDDELYIRLYLEKGVEYNYIEKFRKTFQKLTDNYVLEFADLEPGSTSFSVKGEVKDEFGNGLQNISIIAKGTRIGTVTRENGHFSLVIPSSMKSLVIHHKGHGKIEVPYNELLSMNLSNLSFTLK
jgi:hypothetical protein